MNQLNSHPQVLCYHEPFNQFWWEDTVRLYGGLDGAVDKTYDPSCISDNLGPAGLPSIPKLQEMLYSRMGLDPMSSVPSAIRCIGCKVTVAQAFRDIPSLWDKLAPIPGLAMILLERRDLLARYMSYQRAEQTGTWHSQTPYPESPAKVEIDFPAFWSFVDQQQALDERVASARSAHSGDWLHVTYEGLLQDREATLLKVFDFLELSRPAQVRDGLYRLNPENPRTQIANLSAVEEMAKRTPYERYLKAAC